MRSTRHFTEVAASSRVQRALMEGKSWKIVAAADELGAPLKDALVDHLRSKSIDVEDLGISSYFTAGEEVGKRVAAAAQQQETTPPLTRGLCFCGTGMGVSIFANKFPGVYAAACDSIDEAKNCRSINNSNVLALGAKVTPVEEGKKILDTWLETPFKAPCPASDGTPWPEDIQKFLDASIVDMAKIPLASGAEKVVQEDAHGCALCSLAAARKFQPVEILPGASMTILREDPTSAIVKFKAGSVEPAHHHTFAVDLIVIRGKKRVWNLTKDQVCDLGPGDYLYTPAGDVNRALYFTDTEFFMKWDGHWDIFLDEDFAQAAAAVKQSREPK